MRRFKLLTAVLFLFSFNLSYAAESVFYNNTAPHPFTYRATTLNLGFDEWADDITFSGSHSISSFNLSYNLREVVRATFRFYGVDRVTGNPGNLLMEVVRELPAASGIQHIKLDPVEQFILTAEAGLKRSANSGAWFSIQIEPLDGNTQRIAPIVIKQARGVSARGLFNMTKGTSVSTFDPDGFIPASFYLQLFEDAGAGGSTTTSTLVEPVNTPANPIPTLPIQVTAIELDELSISPSKLRAGSTATATLVLTEAAPVTGVMVMLTTNKPDLVGIPAQVIVPAGQDRLTFTVSTSSNITSDVKVRIKASTNGVSVSDKIKIKP